MLGIHLCWEHETSPPFRQPENTITYGSHRAVTRAVTSSLQSPPMTSALDLIPPRSCLSLSKTVPLPLLPNSDDHVHL